MSRVESDDLDRLEKLVLDTNEATTVDEARIIFSGFRLSVIAGPGIVDSETDQAMLLTMVNCAARAFKGGVFVSLETPDAVATAGWAEDVTLSEAVQRFGGRVVDAPPEDVPVLVVGTPDVPKAEVVLYPRATSWIGYVTPDADDVLPFGAGNALAAVLAAGLAVSEAFQHVRGDVVAGNRRVGLSLWQPERNWRDPEAAGPPIRSLPKDWWLIGLGHLGQAYAWTIGLLPYENRADARLFVQDDDSLVRANLATSLLARSDHLRQRKTRRVAAALEELSFKVNVVERRLGSNQRVEDGEPRWALIGVDNPAARRQLLQPGFELVVDAGLGGGPRDYLDIVVHTFPSTRPPTEVFAGAEDDRGERLVDAPAYRKMDPNGEDRCGIMEIAGHAVATAFVGVSAAALVVSEPVRALHNGPSYEVVDLTLRSPKHRECLMLESERPLRPHFLPARR